VFGIVAELLRSTPAYQQIIYGLILMGFMMFLPRGLASLGRPARA
jgi:branched-chain amino acid transport system permease protein